MASRITILSMELGRDGPPLIAELLVRIDSTTDPGLQAGDELVLAMRVESVHRSGRTRQKTNVNPGALKR